MKLKSIWQSLDCFGTSTGLSCLQCTWPCSSSGPCWWWSARTTLRLSRTSTGREVYNHAKCHNLPAILSSGVRRVLNRCVPSTFQGSSNDSSRSQSGWSGVDSGKPRWTCLLPTSPPTASCITPWLRPPSAQTRWHTAGLRLYASIRFPQLDSSSHRHCARTGRTRSRSCWLRLSGPPELGFQNSCSSRQPLPGASPWDRTVSLRGSAPFGIISWSVTSGV